MSYAGPIYDGPWEGQHRAEDKPWFHVTVPEAKYFRSVRCFDPNLVPDVSDSYRVYGCIYIWSRPLRKWVFDWRSITDLHDAVNDARRVERYYRVNSAMWGLR